MTALNSHLHKLFSSLVLAALAAGCGPAGEPMQETSASLAPELRSASGAFAGWSVEQMGADAAAIEVGERLFAARCASCHGTDGRGKPGVMDLVAGAYNYGDDIDAIRVTITDGRRNEMPAFGRELGEMALSWMAEYLDSLASDEPPSRFAERGKEQFAESCAVCHGADARGNRALGASNLADDYWLHSAETMGIRQIVMRGVESECPAQGDALTATEIELLTAHLVRGRDAKQ
jgi:cytochrome c oxidase cbb3-type subunit 3